MPPPPPRWGLIVDEVLLNATASPARSWWQPSAARFEESGRARILMATITGALIEYGPWDRDDAQFMHDHMTEQGIHPKALTLRRWMPELPKCIGSGRCRRCGRTHRLPITERTDHP
jgi:hypothetical protein